MAIPPLPSSWSDTPLLDGLDLVAKHELVGTAEDPKTFRILGVWFETNKDNINFVYVDAENVKGERFCFNDSSSGVRAEIVQYLTERGMDTVVDTGERVDIKLVIPRGLRVSAYKAQDGRTGRTVEARTYYLTKSGVRPDKATATAVKATATAVKATAAPKRSVSQG